MSSTHAHGARAYAAALDAAGLDPVRIEPIGARVLVPFASHARRQRDALRASGALRLGEWVFLSVIAWLFAWVARHRLFEVVLVTATKRPTPRAPGHCAS